MKKMVAVLLAALMLAVLASCHNGSESETDRGGQTANTGRDPTATAPAGEATTPSGTITPPADTTMPSASTTTPPADQGLSGPSQNVIPSVSGSTLGGKLWEKFLSVCKANPSVTTEELARNVSSIPDIQFAAAVAAVEPGLLSGFDNAPITGFRSGHMFCPIIGSIPFVGYIFQLEAGSDVETFVKHLTDNANPRWNVCTEAGQTVAGSCGYYVFFVMCP